MLGVFMRLKKIFVLAVMFAASVVFADDNVAVVAQDTGLCERAAFLQTLPYRDGVFQEPIFQEYRGEVPLKFKKAYGLMLGLYNSAVGGYQSGEDDDLGNLFKMTLSYDVMKEILMLTVKKKTKTKVNPELTIDHDVMRNKLNEFIAEASIKKGPCVNYSYAVVPKGFYGFRKAKNLKDASPVSMGISTRRFRSCVENAGE